MKGTDEIVDYFHLTCCRKWDREKLAKSAIVRFAEAYLMMAEAGYRPAAPGDGLGGIYLTKAQLKEPGRLIAEACEYAVNFRKEEDGHVFDVGLSDWETNRAFMLCIEAARLLAGGAGSGPFAIALLKEAMREIEDADKD